MKPRARKPTLDTAADHLRAISHASSAGTFVGREEALVEQLGVSRATLRQAARLLEREGLLHVKRGANGGYFTARPNAQTIESIFGSYLDTQRFDPEETYLVAYALWVEAIRAFTRAKPSDVRIITQHYGARIDTIDANAPIVEIIAFENDYRGAILRLIKMPYLELMFQLNRNVTWKLLGETPWQDGQATVDANFTKAWREVKKIEFAAAERGDENATLEIVLQTHELWRERVYGQRDLRRFSTPR